MKRYWLSFDLGLRGNYQELYEWLDELHAEECGDSIATFKSDKSREELAEELLKFLDKKARIYIVESKKGGKFYVGRRKAAPWSGYASIPSEAVDEA